MATRCCRAVVLIDELTKITTPVNSDQSRPECESSGSGKVDNDGGLDANNDIGNTSKPKSYAESLSASKSTKLNFRSLVSEQAHDGCDVVLPKDSVRLVQDKLANTLYGYFLGDRVAFPVVDYFVRNNWKKYGVQKAMMNDNGFFFFKFSDEAGMMNVLKDGPWIIRSQPFFLNIWSPTTKLEKKGVKNVQVWVKIHDVPIAAYTEDGLSMIATTIGVPKALDSYTSSMCMDMWGRSSYARALIEISADKKLREKITLTIPEPEGEGFIKETMSVEFEWVPLRCGLCCVFGHSDDSCPHHPKVQSVARNNSRAGKKPVVDDDGYTGVHGKKVARKAAFPINKPKPKFEYRPVVSNKSQDGASGSSASASRFQSTNPFDALNDPNVAEVDGNKSGEGRGGDGEDEVEEVFNEADGYGMDAGLNRPIKQAEVRQAIKEFKLSFCAILESHVELNNLPHICKSVFRSWHWASNGDRCDKGTRIIVGWNPGIFDVMVLSISDQVFVRDAPWIMLGDFNSALNLEDKSMGCSSISASMREFQACVDDIEMIDLNRSGNHFTWSQKPKKGIGLLKKIDRVMGNSQFIAQFPNAVAIFYPARLSDHCPCVLKVPEEGKVKHRSFKFANFLIHKPDFSQGNLHKKVHDLRAKLDDVQQNVDIDPSSLSLREEEASTRRVYQEALLDEERFLKQKSKVDWILAGRYMKVLRFRKRSLITIKIFWAARETRLRVRPLSYFLLPWMLMLRRIWLDRLQSKRSSRLCFPLVQIKLQGPDGFTAGFFKGAWHIVGSEVAEAVIDFFNSGKLLRELNHTLIVLIPKSPSPFMVTDYRPIACCNVLYKCISKIVADRVKAGLNDIVSINQSAFVPGRKIPDNILLTQELMHNYHRKFGPPKCAFKVDI
ncbi:uncharacterized protein LOC110875957 [Helianthus annuus]|uniref:uncharacterized protein LOC110875957 n=1 Tax=Helianthus annuus TaxID=4232 RepID=UPI000B8FB294|nr:uncharacterized protein LOC110875957 [Helianthus annuus]